ncbi:unnamed protein product [Rotaria sp. Silwood1]|nr:unnamed protein product [Rotaria sp. Silwood1]CAF1673422.1 unnamed protein product [Rotaria sp. Silwood1]
MILLIFNSLRTETVTTTVSSPSLITYNNLQVLYSNTLRCPCSTTTIPYETFISLSPILHQVCSSDFVTDRWLSIVKNVADWTSEDWRNRAYSQFSSLSNYCQLANNTINDAVHRFLLRSLIVRSVMPENEFNIQMNEELDHFFKLTINAFGSLIDIGHLITQVDQPYMGSRTNAWNALPDLNLVGNIRTNNVTNERSLQSYFQNIEYPSWFDVHPLVYDPTLSRYPPNTSISMIVEEMMIEKWNPSYSYYQFYKLCAPTYCTYSQRIRTNTIIEVIIILVSMFRGLTVSLHLITPWFVKFMYYLFLKFIGERQQEQEQSGNHWLDNYKNL